MAYGARLESVLGASPQGFESLILRQSKKPALSGFFLWLDFWCIRTWFAGPTLLGLPQQWGLFSAKLLSSEASYCFSI